MTSHSFKPLLRAPSTGNHSHRAEPGTPVDRRPSLPSDSLHKAEVLVILCCTEFSVKHLFLVFPSSPAYEWTTSWWWGKWTVFIPVIMLSGSPLVPYLLWLVRTEDWGHLSEETPWAFLQGKPLAAFRPVLLTEELLKLAMGQPSWFYHFLWF